MTDPSLEWSHHSQESTALCPVELTDIQSSRFLVERWNYMKLYKMDKMQREEGSKAPRKGTSLEAHLIFEAQLKI
jgi:hypothetical protein